MSYKIAIATKDGKVVSEHFGHSKKFCIVSIDENAWKVIEVREVEPACTGVGCTYSNDSSNSHLESIVKVAKVLSDCKFVIVSQIGYGAEQVLNINQLEVRLHKGLIIDYLNSFTTLKEKLGK